MLTISVVPGVGSGPTPIAAYDAALADAGVHNYNLVVVSSVIPAGSEIEVFETAPDLGPVGDKLTVVEARVTTGTDGAGAAAGLGWTLDETGRGLFYEATGTDPERVHERVAAGLAAGRDLREWSFVEERIVTADATHEPTAGKYTTAVVVGVYGDSDPIA